MKLLADILIYGAGILWAIECIPQVVKLLRTKDTKGISLLFFCICWLAYLLFIVGNLLLKQWSVIIANLFPFTVISVVIYLVLRYRRVR